jgi:hypothetical protein
MYHLECNPSQPAQHSYVGADGSVVGDAATGRPGYYPYVG